MSEELTPAQKGAITKAKNAKAKKEPAAYMNVSKSNVFTAAGRCKPNESIAMTPEEVKIFGDKVKKC